MSLEPPKVTYQVTDVISDKTFFLYAKELMVSDPLFRLHPKQQTFRSLQGEWVGQCLVSRSSNKSVGMQATYSTIEPNSVLSPRWQLVGEVQIESEIVGIFDHDWYEKDFRSKEFAPTVYNEMLKNFRENDLRMDIHELRGVLAKVDEAPPSKTAKVYAILNDKGRAIDVLLSWGIPNM